METSDTMLILIPIYAVLPNVIRASSTTTIIIIITTCSAFIMRTFPSRVDVQGATYHYYPGRWIQFQDRTYSVQFPLPREHSILTELPIMALQANTYNTTFTSYRVPIY